MTFYSDGSAIEDDFLFKEIENLSENDVERNWKSFIHAAAYEFWTQVDTDFSREKTLTFPDTNISFSQVCINILECATSLLKENDFSKGILDYINDDCLYIHDGRYYIILERNSDITICIDKQRQEFTIHFLGQLKIFKSFQWELGLAWLRECVKNSPVWEVREKALVEKFYTNAKSTIIIIISLRTLVKSFFKEKGMKYKMVLFYIESEIIFETMNHLFYYIKIYNKTFSMDPWLLITILNNPHEEEITDKLSCKIISLPKEKEDNFNEEGFFTLKDSMIIE